MMLTDLAVVIRAAGLPVYETPDWKTRGRGPMVRVSGVILHHTAGPAKGDYPSLGTVQSGRPDLPGPLSHLGLGRSGTVYVIAAGISNHAGAPDKRLAGLTGNTDLIGIEAESVGDGEDWTDAQVRNYPILAWALAKHYGFGSPGVIGHREWAPSRKIDPAGIDLVALRRAVTSDQIPGGSLMTAQFETDVRGAIDRDFKRDTAFDKDVRSVLQAMRDDDAIDDAALERLDRDLRGAVERDRVRDERFDKDVRATLATTLAALSDLRAVAEETRADVRGLVTTPSS